METCEVVIIGGGPAGSSCAWSLHQAGLDVVVVDRAVFPRDKVCAGWITPQVLDDLRFDPDEYRHGRTFQPITAFRVGVIGDGDVVDASYDHAVSFGIRRCEFDDFLLRRSGARLLLGASPTTIRRDGPRWIVNERLCAPMLVGAAGHFCPVARLLNGAPARAPLVAAQEMEVPIDPDICRISGERPELYFCPDLSGYGWCFRKGDYVNIGFGRLKPHGLPGATAEFLEFLNMRWSTRLALSAAWHGHAYLLSASSGRRAVDDGVILAGDAAGLAYPQSGEGIRPAIESGLMAASTIVEADGCYSRDRLQPYVTRLQERWGEGGLSRLLSRIVPKSVPAALGPRLIRTPWFVRRVVLDRWFLPAQEPALAAELPRRLPRSVVRLH